MVSNIDWIVENLLNDSQREGIVTVLRAVSEKFLVMG